MSDIRDKLCLAADIPAAKVLQIVEQVGDLIGWVKLSPRHIPGDVMLLARTLKAENPHLKIFLDLKIHDIPNTVEEIAYALSQSPEIDMFNVHALGGWT